MLFILDFLLISSDPTLSTDMRSIIGIAMIAIMSLLIFFSLGSQVLESCRMIKLKVQRYFRNRKVKKHIMTTKKKQANASAAPAPVEDCPIDMSFGEDQKVDVD